tara:strand:- start:1278 stop:1682 length:405 start_codon:yes stop_codon:yes gene_type:complete
MTVKLLTLKPKQDVIADIEEIRTTDEEPRIVGYQLSHPYIITLSRMMNEDQTVSDSISVNISRWNPFSSDTVFQIPADMVSVICEPLPKLKESWEEKVATEEKVVRELSQPPSENTVIEQELLNEERTDSDTEE